MSNHHIANYRIYYEDTDAGGVVYYANYLKFAERARTDFLRDRGIIQSKLIDSDGLFFVVRHAELDLFKPARLDDLVQIKTSILEFGGASLIMIQEIMLDDIKLADIKVKVVSVCKKMKPARLPDKIKQLLSGEGC